MYLAKKQRIEKINSISNCFNDLVGDLHKKKSLIQDKNNTNNLRLSRHDSPSSEKNLKKYEGLSLDKIIHHQNFDKKYTQIMSALSLSPKKQVILDSPEQKNILLWDLKIKKDGSLGKDQSLKRLEDLKLRMVYNQDLEIPEEQKLYQNFLNLNTATFKQSNSSDFFKSTNNSESKTLYSSKNSFYNSANNFNNFNNFNSNSNSNNLNYYNSNNNEGNKLENLSFYSYKSFSSKQSKNNPNNINNKYEKDSLSNRDLNSFGNYNIEKTRGRVNFDDFNTIGENPFKINIYETHNQINSARKKVNLKNSDLNISPKNIYSPSKDGLSYFPNKRIFDIDHLYDNAIKYKKSNLIDLNKDPNAKIKSGKNLLLDLNIRSDLPSGKSRINLSPKSGFGAKENLSNLLKGSVNDRNRMASGLQSSRQYTLKRIDNLLKNFSNKSGSFLNKQENVYKKLVL